MVWKNNEIHFGEAERQESWFFHRVMKRSKSCRASSSNSTASRTGAWTYITPNTAILTVKDLVENADVQSACDTAHRNEKLTEETEAAVLRAFEKDPELWNVPKRTYDR